MPLRRLIEERRKRWLGARTIVGGGLVLGLLVLVALAALAAYELDERRQDDARRVELLAQMAGDQCAALLDAAAATLDTLALEVAVDLGDRRLDAAAALQPPGGFGAVGIDGLTLRDEVGRLLAGAAGRGDRPAIALTRSVAAPGGRRYLLAASLDLRPFADRLERVTATAGDAAAVLADASGHVLASTASAGLSPRQVIVVPPQDGKAHLGAGMRRGEQVGAARRLAHPPLVVVFEQAREASTEAWRSDMRPFALAAAAVELMVVFGTALALRAFRSREAVRRRLDHALIELAQRGAELDALVGSVQELMFRTDAAGRLSFANARWLAATGRAAPALLGRPLAELAVAADRSAIAALFATRGAAGIGHAQARFVAADGVERHFNVAVVPMFDQGRLVGFAGSAVDVTEQVLAERRLKSQLAHNALLVEVSPLPTSLVDAQGRILTVNHAWEAFRGRRKDEVVGRPIAELVDTGEVERLQAQNAIVLASGGSLRYEASMAAGDGSRRDLVLTKVAVFDAEHGPAVLTVSMDVSEFREAERVTRQARDLAEEASRAKSEFVANISHELRTPLQSILGYSELGLARSREQPRLNAMFGDVHAAGQRMLALVNDLLDVSKMESAVGTFHLERGDVRPWVRGVVRELDPLLAPKRLSVELDLGASPLVARVDPLRLQQVMRNVLANAIKFSPAGASIEVQGGGAGDGELELAVRDHGPGVPPAELETIFEAFVQSSQTRSGAGGTGLGLAISRKIVAAHGGRIWAENMADGGSCFRIRLPAVRAFAETGALA